jgi:hypothetical protein
MINGNARVQELQKQLKAMQAEREKLKDDFRRVLEKMQEFKSNPDNVKQWAMRDERRSWFQTVSMWAFLIGAILKSLNISTKTITEFLSRMLTELLEKSAIPPNQKMENVPSCVAPCCMPQCQQQSQPQISQPQQQPQADPAAGRTWRILGAVASAASRHESALHSWYSGTAKNHHRQQDLLQLPPVVVDQQSGLIRDLVETLTAQAFQLGKSAVFGSKTVPSPIVMNTVNSVPPQQPATQSNSVKQQNQSVPARNNRKGTPSAAATAPPSGKEPAAPWWMMFLTKRITKEGAQTADAINASKPSASSKMFRNATTLASDLSGDILSHIGGTVGKKPPVIFSNREAVQTYMMQSQNQTDAAAKLQHFLYGMHSLKATIDSLPSNHKLRKTLQDNYNTYTRKFEQTRANGAKARCKPSTSSRT